MALSINQLVTKMTLTSFLVYLCILLLQNMQALTSELVCASLKQPIVTHSRLQREGEIGWTFPSFATQFKKAPSTVHTHHGCSDEQHDATGCRSAASVVRHEASEDASLRDTFNQDRFQSTIEQLRSSIRQVDGALSPGVAWFLSLACCGINSNAN